MKSSAQTIQGAAQLIFDSVEGITNSVEQMHETIARLPLPLSPEPEATQPSQRHGAIAAAVYNAIRTVSNTVRVGVDQSIGMVAERSSDAPGTKAEVKVAAALNGVCGDHLEATDNPLTIAMHLRTETNALVLNRDAIANCLPQASPHLVILLHGLSLSELSWVTSDGTSLGNTLQEELDCTPLYLRYNTGRHISTNGQELALQLEQLCAAWPVTVQSISLIGHSMGGLVIRSACWYAQQDKHSWVPQLQRIICLGTPHHGSPVARAGHALDSAMRMTPYVRPLAFGRRRSAGIKDLRHGDLLDEDWLAPSEGADKTAARRNVPLLPDVDYYFAAATLARDADDTLGHLLGDMLVRLDSAVGSHRDELQHLPIAAENCRVFHQKNHFDLLTDEQVHRQIVGWFDGGCTTRPTA